MSDINLKTSKTYYIYMLYESPIEKPYYCKIGFTHDPLRRLDQLQSGNPRHLRTWDFERRPTKPFGFPLPTKEHACRLESLIHSRLEEMGLRVRRDVNYETFKAPVREWFAELHPEKMWFLIGEMHWSYIR